MITSIFSKSKPINLVIVFFVMLLAFFVAHLKFANQEYVDLTFLKKAGIFLVCYLSVLVLNFIAEKNSLTQKNNFEVLLFSLFFLCLPQVATHPNIIYANFFVLLGLRRIISLRSQKNVSKKLFDAAFWISIATFFFFWSALFLLLIFVALLLFSNNNAKHWIIPVTGVATVFIIAISTSLLLYDSYFEVFKSLPETNFNFSNYNTTQYIIVLTLFVSFSVWSSIFYLKAIKQKTKTLRPSFYIILIGLFIAIAVAVLSPQKNGSEFLFLFAPLTIIIANYIEVINEKWFKEVFLSVLILLPFALLLL